MHRSQKLTRSFILLNSLAVMAAAQPPSNPPPSPPYQIGRGVTQPQLLHKVEPEYSEEARNAKWQGTVQLEIVVDESGVPKDVRVKRALGLGLDQKAIDAVKQWRFKPGQKDGMPVPVIAVIDVSFRLLDDPPVLPSAPPDPEKRALIEEMLKLSNGDKMVDQILNQLRGVMMQQVRATLDQQLPKNIDRASFDTDLQNLEKQVFDVLSVRFKAQFPSIIVNIYSDAFSVEELSDLVAFYKTTSGQAMLKKQPELVTKGGAAGLEIARQASPELQRLTQAWAETMKKKYGAQ